MLALTQLSFASGSQRFKKGKLMHTMVHLHPSGPCRSCGDLQGMPCRALVALQ